MRFQDKVVLITGGTRGVGLATARAFAQEGARVVMTGLDVTRGREAAGMVLRATFIGGDVRLPADCDRIVGEAVGQLGRLDVLVNNAGVIYRNRTVEQTTDEEWDTTFAVNVKGAFLMSRRALPALRATRGSIVHVASYAGLVGFAGAAAYAASKAALVNLTRTMALDHAAEGIRVNCVCPGSVDTDMIHQAWEAFPDPVAARRRWEEKHPLGRIAAPDEVARTIVFLASDDAGFITGVALPVDGGITAG
jgi:meso-butanediol dehydrogenase/(S,S)-butanediol dehydrogenase/diacetyl reductase